MKTGHGGITIVAKISVEFETSLREMRPRQPESGSRSARKDNAMRGGLLKNLPTIEHRSGPGCACGHHD